MYKFLFVVLALFSVGCTSNTKEIDVLFKEKIQPDQTGKNIKMIYSDSANVMLILESPVFVVKESNKGKNIIYPKGIKISFLDKSNTPKSWLIADRAINRVKEKKFIARGNVQLYNNQNEKLESSELVWDEKNEILSTEKFVKITQPAKGDTLYGYGFVSNREFTEFEIKHRLFGKIKEDLFKDIK